MEDKGSDLVRLSVRVRPNRKELLCLIEQSLPSQ